jgi:hypothetical protein
MSEQLQKVGETEAFYHALYHQVTHWAAYVAMLTVLLTIAFLLCLTPIAGDAAHDRIIVIAIVVGGSLASSMFFALGIRACEDDVTNKLPASYIARMRRIRHPHLPIVLGVVCSTASAALDWWLLYESWK